MVEKRSGCKYIPFMEPEDRDMEVVSMIKYNENIYVATKKGIYILKDEKFHRLDLVEKEE